MIRSFDELIRRVQNGGRRRMTVAVAQDAEVLLAVEKARQLGLVEAVLIGDEPAIRRIAEQEGIDPDRYEILHEPEGPEACHRAVKMVRDGNAQAVMKGIIDTAVILRAVLDKEDGLRMAPVLSHVAVFQAEGFDRFFYITDAAMNIAPDLAAKSHIIQNAVRVAHALGNENPVAACLCAVEKVNPKMQATLDAQALVEMNRRGEIPGCTVIGPLALDNAISPEAARHKGISDPNAGKADILLVPYIEAGNIFYKALTYMAHAKNAGCILGARAPVILTSRADSDETKLYSIALALRVAAAEE